MPQYLLSVHTVEGEEAPHTTPEQMRLQMKELAELEADMRAGGSWQFSGRLHGAESATVVRKVGGRRLTTDGPFAESKEHLGGFYVIEAADLDEALHWAERTVDVIGKPIEVWPFVSTAGR